jgi:hypothetical protein
VSAFMRLAAFAFSTLSVDVCGRAGRFHLQRDAIGFVRMRAALSD